MKDGSGETNTKKKGGKKRAAMAHAICFQKCGSSFFSGTRGSLERLDCVRKTPPPPESVREGLWRTSRGILLSSGLEQNHRVFIVINRSEGESEVSSAHFKMGLFEFA